MAEFGVSRRIANPDNLLAPGLLRILQQAAALRLGLILFEMGLGLVTQTTRLPLDGPMLGFVAERTLLLILLLSSHLRRYLGRWLLPLVLGWLFVTPMLEVAQSTPFTNPGFPFIAGRFEVRDISSPLIWLVLPMVLATWQYGYRGLRIGFYVLVLEHVLSGLVLWNGAPFLHGYLLNTTFRILVVTLIGYVVAYLAEGQRAEHAALEQANRQLAHRAATAEQLAESRERNRMAREMHDILAHSLSGLSVQLQALGTLMAYDPEAAKPQLKEAQATVRTGINEVRRAIQALRATPLEDLGLSEALRQLCQRQAERTGTAFICQIDSLAALDPLAEQSLYRVATAALANVEQHAAATKVTVSLQLLPKEKAGPVAHPALRLEIADNGVGFDPRSVPQDRYGLAGMAERAALTGGILDVDSAPGQGTRIVLVAPVG